MCQTCSPLAHALRPIMNLPTLELLHVIPTESPCLLTHIYSTINLNGSDLHQISRQPIRSHYRDPRLTLDATQLGHPLSLATHNNTIEHKIRPFHGRAQGALSKTTPPLKQIMPLYHGPVSPQHKTMLSLLYAQLKIQTNSILRASNSAATGANKLHSESIKLGSNGSIPHHLTATSRLNHLCSILLSTRWTAQ